MWRGERHALDVLKEKVDPDAKYIWFHAASLGELSRDALSWSVFAEIIQNIRYCSFFSPSGYEVRKDYQGADIICYLPLDTIRNARRFCVVCALMMAFFIKYEFWYNYLHILQTS